MAIERSDYDDLRRLTNARTLDAPALVDHLRYMTGKTHSVGRGSQMDECEKLLDEAFWYARHGEFDEALYRLSSVQEPKKLWGGF